MVFGDSIWLGLDDVDGQFKVPAPVVVLEEPNLFVPHVVGHAVRNLKLLRLRICLNSAYNNLHIH